MLFATLFTALAFLVLCGLGLADDLVREDRIKVFLYAAPAFWQEVAVDAYRNACVNLANNLIDGKVRSILIGGHDVVAVLQRTDDWYCTFYNNYDCSGNEDDMLSVGDGVNNLQTKDTEVHALKCRVENESQGD